MRRAYLNKVLCSLLAAAMLIATSQYLAHFHILQPHTASDARTHDGQDAGHGAQEHCSLCLQFDRLPAPPAPLMVPTAIFHLVATLEAERLERLALQTPQLWPPSRGPPRLA